MQNDTDDDIEHAVPAPHWFDSLGAGAIAALGATVFFLTILVTALVNQIGAASQGKAATQEVEIADFAAPPPAIASRASLPLGDMGVSHAQPFDTPPNTPLIALVILDDGTNSAEALRALDWSVPVNVAVAADFEASPYRIKQVRQAGHEALALLPFGYGAELGQDPNVLRRGLPEPELRRRLGWHLARAGEGVVGVIDHRAGDSRRDLPLLKTVGTVLAREGLLMVDSGEQSDNLLAASLRHDGVPVGRQTIRIGRYDATEVSRVSLIAAERHAYAWGTAIVIVEAGDTSMAAVSDWLRTRSDKIALAPISYVIGRLRIGSVGRQGR